MSTPVLLALGLGYTAETWARRWRQRGLEVRGTSRDPARRAALERQAIRTGPFDRTTPLAPELLAGVTHVLISIAPDAQGDPALDGAADALARLSTLRWVGYLGTTAVYGDRGGDWVDEDSPLRPSSPRAVARVAAERGWLATGLPVHLFRLAGIYGPGRNPIRDLLDGTARRIVKPGQVFSRIHVEDIATVLEASIAAPRPGRAYNVCDDEPAPPQDVVAFAADLLGVTPPPEQPFATAELSPMARSFYMDNRRVRNARIKAELGVRLAYPTYREGLRALLPLERAQRGPG